MPDPDVLNGIAQDLIYAVERLGEEIQLLRQAVDDLGIELQWRNNEHSHDRPSQPFVLTSMPIDPAAADWKINRFSASDLPADDESGAAARPRKSRLFD